MKHRNSANLCEICSVPQPDTAYICHKCALELDQRLGNVSAWWLELDNVLSRQTRYGSGSEGRRSAEIPLPYDPRATEVAFVVSNTITTWTRHICETRPCEFPQWPYIVPSATLTGLLAGFLVGHTEWLRHRQEGAEAFDELTAMTQLLERTIDRPAPLWYAGPCNCRRDLYAQPGATTITCPDCEAQYDVSARRQWLLDSAEDHLAHAALISRAITMLGEPVDKMTISRWVAKGRLIAHGVDRDGRALYRVGDVIDLTRNDTMRHSKAVG